MSDATMSDSLITRRLPVGSVLTYPAGWLAMLFLVASEGSLFAHLMFSYWYLSAQPHPGSTWPPSGMPPFTFSIPESVALLLVSGAMWWAYRAIRIGLVFQLMIGLAVAAFFSAVFIGVELWEWSTKSFHINTDVYSSIYYTTTGLHMAHVAIGLFMFVMLLIWSFLGYFDRMRNSYIAMGRLYAFFLTASWLALFFMFYISPYFGVR